METSDWDSLWTLIPDWETRCLYMPDSNGLSSETTGGKLTMRLMSVLGLLTENMIDLPRPTTI